MASTGELFYFYEQAESHLAKGELQKAADLCKQILDLDSNFAHGHHLMASLFRRTGNYDKALKFSLAAINHDPVIGVFYLQLGQILFSQQKWAAAVEAFAKGESLEPHDALYPLLQGTALAQMGKFDEALACFSRARLRADIPDIDEHEGLCRLQKGDAVQAEMLFDRLLANRPAYEWAHVHKGKALLAQGKAQQAEQSFSRALECNGDNQDAQQWLAYAQKETQGAAALH